MSKATHTPELEPQPVEKFGTFLGVFTPSVLTILGLIMYLRFGWVVGNLGLPLTLLTVLLASSVTMMTALSASALATNMRVGVGGEYFMVARSLGLELGGAIGIPLYLCRTLSITFYAYGLAESVYSLASSPVSPLQIQLTAAVIVVIITAVAGKSAGLALKLQIPIMVAVGLSLAALTIGALSNGMRAPELTASYRTAPASFWYVFAVFFPAVTGVTAGIGLSGDLRNPQRSIPTGTLAAVGTGTLMYLLVPIILASSERVNVETLAEPGVLAWTGIAIFGSWLVFPGMWGAILSSAFGSVLGGPRVLQALARDDLLPRFLARTSKSGQPTVATWVSGGIALAAIALGGLNAVAQFVTILFLTLYVAINMSAAAEGWAASPSYRPTIKVPWQLSLLGSLAAVVVMFLISPFACVAALLLEVVLYLYLRRKSLKRRWGDARAGVWMTLARLALLQLSRHEPDPRNWRPHLLVFVGDLDKRLSLVRLASWFNQDRGLVTASQILVGDITRETFDVEKRRREMDAILEQEGLVAFSEIDVVQDFEAGVVEIAQANGVRGLQSNTVLAGWPKKPGRLEAWLRIMRGLSRLGKSTVIARLNWGHEPGQRQQIDIWWGGLEKNGDLMLLLAHLVSLNPEWHDARIVVRSIVREKDERADQEESLQQLIEEVRIDAEAWVVVKPASHTIAQVIQEHSSGADLVFLGLQEPAPGKEERYARQMHKLSDGLRTTVFVRNAGEFAGKLI